MTRFPSPFVEGYGWDDETGELEYPGATPTENHSPGMPCCGGIPELHADFGHAECDVHADAHLSGGWCLVADIRVATQDASGNGNGAGSSADGNGSSPGDDEENQLPDLYESWHPKNPYEVRVDMPNLLSPELQ